MALAHLSLVHTSEISTSTSTNARHTHAQNKSRTKPFLRVHMPGVCASAYLTSVNEALGDVFVAFC